MTNSVTVNDAPTHVDLDELDTVAFCDKGAEFELTHPATGKPLGMFVTVFGKDSTIFRETMNARINERISTEALATERGDKLPIKSVEMSSDENTILLARCTKSWRNFTLNGKKLECNFENAKMVYSKWLWMRAQVDKAIGNLENFMKL